MPFVNQVLVELFGLSTGQPQTDWPAVVQNQHCPFLARTCIKIRKSQPEVAIGTCTIRHGSAGQEVIICPHRLLERRQVFLDSLHLLTLHEPGNELHVLSEIPLPGGSVDFFVVSTRDNRVIDFVGIELQALDTTGTVWPIREQFLQSESGLLETAIASKSYGINWKMTAKTTLLQLHHKIETFEKLGKHFVLVLQDVLLDYMRREFNFEHVGNAKQGDAMHFHAYQLQMADTNYRIQLSNRASTTANGIARCLGLQANPNVEMEQIIAILQKRLSARTRLLL